MNKSLALEMDKVRKIMNFVKWWTTTNQVANQAGAKPENFLRGAEVKL